MLREVACEETNGEDLLHVRSTSQLKLNVPTYQPTNTGCIYMCLLLLYIVYIQNVEYAQGTNLRDYSPAIESLCVVIYLPHCLCRKAKVLPSETANPRVVEQL